MKMLFVSPDEHILRKLAPILPTFSAGHEFDFSANMPEQCVLETYSKVLITHNLPEQNGLKYCRTLRQICPKIPLGIIARSLTGAEIQEAHELAACEFYFLPSDDCPVVNAPTVPSFGHKLRAWAKRFLAPDHNLLHFMPPEFAPATMNGGAPAIWVKLFGQFSIVSDGHQLTCPLARKERMVLAFLLQNFRRSITVNELLETFWDNADAASARNSLNVALNHIRDWAKSGLPALADLRGGLILFKDGRYFINPAILVASDADQFSHWFQTGRGHEQDRDFDRAFECYDRAHQLYGGNYLEEFADESWVEAQAYRYQAQSLGMLMKLSRYFLEQRDWATAREICQKLLSEDACIEEGYWHLFAVHAARGDRAAAEKTFQRCTECLQKSLGSAPSRTTKALFAHAQAGELENILKIIDT